MTIDRLLKGVRSLVLSTALAYSACGGGGDGDDDFNPSGCRNDFDCPGDQVCNYRNGRCESEGGEGEAEAEGEGCDDWEGRFCTCYEEVCPGVMEAFYRHKGRSLDWNECNSTWTLDMMLKHNDAAFFLCQMETGFCVDPDDKVYSNQIEDYPQMLDCLESYGHLQCEKDSNCEIGQGEQCIDGRCL